MWVKICGNTRRDDVLRAQRLGADAVGFIFAHGKRLVTAEQARSITAVLPASLPAFGVFTQTDASFILDTAERAGINGIQLHTGFDRTLVQTLRPHTAHLVQVVPWWTDRPADAQAEQFRAHVSQVAATGLVDAVLLDSRTASASGGTGIAMDWQTVTRALDGVSARIILAGGLRPETVSKAISILRPWGVDVSSGVEDSPGVKNPERLEAFLHAANA